ncbi:MAG: hypothetical protein AB8G86_01215 [Saprospiraceae bacterium]
MYIKNQHDLVADAFEKGYSSADLKESFFVLTRDFVQKNMTLLVREEVPKKVVLLGTLKNLTKREMALFVTIPYLNKQLFTAFKFSLSNEVEKLLNELVFEEKMTQAEIEKRLGIKVYDTQKSRYSGYEQISIKEGFKFFRHVNIHRYSTLKKPEYTFYLEPSVRRIIAIYYDKPTNSSITSIKELEETHYVYDKGQVDIMLELPRLMAYAQQGNIKVSSKGKPAASTLGKMQRKLNLAEFYPNEKVKSTSLLRTNLLAGLIATIGAATSTTELSTFIKTLIQSYYANNYRSIHQLLTYLKGTGHVDTYYLVHIEHHLVHLLGELPENEWVSVANISKYLKFNFKDIRPIKEYIARNKLYYEYDAAVKYERYAYRESKHYIDNARYDKAITLPTLQGSLFLFAAFGLLDIAYNEIDATVMGQTCNAPFDGLKYIRLNNLGAYVAGKQTKYDAPQEVSHSTIELSKDSLTIISDKNDPTAAIILEPYTEKVTPNRFRTDFSIFLKGISDKKELADKIKIFKQSVTADLPPNWEAFFEQLSQKIDPLTQVTTMHVFQIPDNNPDLIKLIARDAKLKSLCFKAEGYHILIPKKKFAQFKARLREFGYLMSS